ncbi:MAG TPA: AlpA family phage regulatory protein [Legionella sp.]|nr:AlpA family phage regulatory protein [Legionella sp.]
MNELPILLYPHHVQKLLGIGSTKFYELVKLPDFPKPRDLLGKRSIYLRKEIEDWVSNLAPTEVKKNWRTS